MAEDDEIVVYDSKQFNATYRVIEDGVAERWDNKEPLIPFTVFKGEITRDIMELALKCPDVETVSVSRDKEILRFHLNCHFVDSDFHGLYIYVENEEIKSLTNHDFLELFEIVEGE